MKDGVVLWLLLLLSLCSFDDEGFQDQTSILVFKAGKRLVLTEPYQLEGKLVIFKNKHGQTLQVPAGIVDLEESDRLTRGYHERREARLNYKQKEKVKEALPRTLYREEGGKGKQVYDFGAFRKETFAEDTDYFETEKCWRLFREGEQLLEHTKLKEMEQKEIADQMERLSKQIWECKASDKRRSDIDELTWEGYRRNLKQSLDQRYAEMKTLLNHYRGR